MRLIIKEVIDREICHYAGPEFRISSLYRTVYVQEGANEFAIHLPGEGWKEIGGRFRLWRRAFRLDKCNVVRVEGGLLIVRQGKVFRYDWAEKTLRTVLRLHNSRNVLHQSIAVIDQREVFLGEYGANPSRDEVPIYRSRDGGKTWEIVFSFPPGKIRHVHGCYYDPFEGKIWTLTGDFENECYILCSDKDFQQIEWIGNGRQTYRACNLFFQENTVHWIMDSQLQDNYHFCLDRKTRAVERRGRFPGPVWYIKQLEDGYFVAATAQEIGPRVHDRYAHLLVSQDLQSWVDVYPFEHDGLPKRFFKFGVIGFADGPQTSQGFYLFAEAVKRLDGKIAYCELR
ncbi:MAG: hypothetical protein ABIN58_03265 [candidate division WOR-3 bacterium]